MLLLSADPRNVTQNPVCSKVSEVTERMRWRKVRYCTGLDAIARERYKQKNTMLRDPHIIKRSDFWTKLKYSPAIEAVHIAKQLTLIANKLFRKWINPVFIWGLSLLKLCYIQSLWPWVLLAARKQLLFKFWFDHSQRWKEYKNILLK